MEQCVFGKLYFDYPGMILAMDDQRPVGFAHAAFGPNEPHNGTSHSTGVIPLVFVQPEFEETDLGDALLERCEQYLAQRGARVIFGGGFRPIAPFYLGLYGGCEPPGILESDAWLQTRLRGRAYQPWEEMLIFRLELSGFRPTVDRQQAQFRRRLLVQVIVDPPSSNWWEACTLGDFQLTRFELVERGGRVPLARAVVGAIEGADGFLPGPAVSLLDLEVDPAHRRQGLASFLLGEAFRHIAEQGIKGVEVHARQSNAAGLSLLGKLGFQQVGRGTVFRKELPR